MGQLLHRRATNDIQVIASTLPLRTCLPQPTQGPRSAFQTARMTTEYISWR